MLGSIRSVRHAGCAHNSWTSCFAPGGDTPIAAASDQRKPSLQKQHTTMGSVSSRANSVIRFFPKKLERLSNLPN